MATYQLTWKMEAAAVAHRAKIGQYNAWALQVDGAGALVAWYNRKPIEETELDIPVGYGIYYCDKQTLSDGTKITNTSKNAASLGNAYSWDGSQFAVSGPCDKSAITILNSSDDDGTFGLTKNDPSGNPQPISADILTSGQPGTYTPVMTIYVVMGKSYSTNSVIAHIGNLQQFDLSSTVATFNFDDAHSKWQIAPSAKFLSTKEKALARMALGQDLVSDFLLGVAGNLLASVITSACSWLKAKYVQSRATVEPRDAHSVEIIVHAGSQVDLTNLQNFLSTTYPTERITVERAGV